MNNPAVATRWCSSCGRPVWEVWRCPDCGHVEFSLVPTVLFRGWLERMETKGANRE